jgi:hypothetical protein
MKLSDVGKKLRMKHKTKVRYHFIELSLNILARVSGQSKKTLSQFLQTNLSEIMKDKSGVK